MTTKPKMMLPPTMAELIQRNADLDKLFTQQQERRLEVEAHRDGLSVDLTYARDKIKELNASLAEAREKFGDLRAMFHDSEKETARLRGVIERVHEQDRLQHPLTTTTVTTDRDSRPATPDLAVMRGRSDGRMGDRAAVGYTDRHSHPMKW